MYLLFQHRSLKSNYTEHHLHFKRFQDSDPREERSVQRRGFSPHCAPIIVEHDHGIPKHDTRIHNPGRERRDSRDPARERGDPRNHDLIRDRERPRSRDPDRDRERPRSGGPVRDREHPWNRGSVITGERSRSRDPGREREYSRGSGPVRHQEDQRSHDQVRDRDHPRSRDHLSTRDPPGDRDYSKSREPQRGGDPTRGREFLRGGELCKPGRDYNYQPGTSYNGSSGSSSYRARENPKFHPSSAERSPLRGMRHYEEQPRIKPLLGDLHRPGRRATDDRDLRMDGSDRARASLCDWEEETRPRGSRRGLLENVLKGNHQHRNQNHPGVKTDFGNHETLKIKVDMSRPVGHSRYSIAAAVL